MSWEAYEVARLAGLKVDELRHTAFHLQTSAGLLGFASFAARMRQAHRGELGPAALNRAFTR